jgi:dipeptidyl aminopeptidase/acylaminoacyl peptidase
MGTDLVLSDFEPTVRFKDTLAVSPDGRFFAYVDDALGQFNLAVRPMSGGGPRYLTSYSGSTARAVSWHPDGRSLLHIADTGGNEAYQLYLVDVETGVRTALTDAPGSAFHPAIGDPFSPDGKLLAYAGNDRNPADQDVLVRDLVSGEVRRVFDRGGRVYAGHWSPDGTRLTVTEWRGATTDRVVHVVHVDDGRIERLTPEDTSATFQIGPWLPGGDGMLVLTDLGRDLAGLAVLDVATRELTWIDQPGWEIEEVALSRDGSTLAWLVNVDGASQLKVRDLATGRDRPVPALPPGHAAQLRLTADGRRVVVRMSTPTVPWNVLSVDLDSGEQAWLTDARPAVDASAFVEPVLVRYPARDGTTVPAYLYRPPSPGDDVPVVVAVHGGPPTQERPTYSNDGLFQYLASRGVAVFAPNIRGSSGYGLAYQRAVHRDWGGIDLSDLDDAARYLKGQPWVGRLGLLGRSYGGFAVLSCVSRLPEHDWAAAVAWCAPSNLVTFTRSQPPTWRTQVAIMVGDPDTDAEFLTGRSPFTHADRIRAPLFLIQGANDPRVPRPESDQIVARLRGRGIGVRYDIYPDEGHVFGRSENQHRAHADAAEFLLKHLKKR